MKFLKWLFPLLFVVNLCIVLYVWFHGSGAEIWDADIAGPLIALGDLAGLSAFYLILWQLLLIGRTGWIERYWGHDRLSHLHHTIGIIAVLVLAIHPVLLTLGYSQLAQTTLVGQFIQFTFHYPDVLRAVLAYFMFLGIVFLSIYIVIDHLRYETWYFIHVTLYVAVICAFGHQLTNGHDLISGGIFSIYWQVLFWGTLATVSYYRLLKPLWRFQQHKFYVEGIHQETNNVTSVIIGGKNIDKLKAKSGQFLIVRFLAKGFWWEAHPFSLSEMPSGRRLRHSIKAVGDFTGKLPNLSIGTRVVVEGPLGIFTSGRATKDKILLIAGGIGITPLRALFEEFAGKNRNVELLYAARLESDFALKEELNNLSNPHAQVHYLPEDKVGRLTEELIKTNVPDIGDRYIYLCGPPPMMQAVREQLANLGISKEFILYEKFQLG